MNNLPSSPRANVPSIHILDADDTPPFDWSGTEICSLYNASEDTGLYSFSQGLQPEFLSSNPSPELDEMLELSYLSTTGQEYLSGPGGYSVPYGIIQENATMTPIEIGLSPSSFSSPAPSPSSSFGGSLSPSSLYDYSALSDSESPMSPSLSTPDDHLAPAHGSNIPFARSFPSDSTPISISLGPGPNRPRSHSSPSTRRGPVASKAMLEANGRRRRHPAQWECTECKQTFTALFSLKRHAQSHTGERPFACSIPGCTQRFFNSSDCKRHEKSKKRHKELLMQ